MSRRQHVVRTDDQGGVGSARSLAGCRVLCATQDCGDVYQGGQTLIAAIPVTSNRTYQRCFVSATIGRINASIPDPEEPGPGTWTVRFECNVDVPAGLRWKSVAYNSPWTENSITHVDYDGSVGYQGIGWFTGITEVGAGTDQSVALEAGAHSEDFDPPLVLDEPIRLEVNGEDGTLFCTVTLSSPRGEDMQDVLITDGFYG